MLLILTWVLLRGVQSSSSGQCELQTDCGYCFGVKDAFLEPICHWCAPNATCVYMNADYYCGTDDVYIEDSAECNPLTTTQIIIIGAVAAGIVVVLLVGYFWWNYQQQKKEEEQRIEMQRRRIEDKEAEEARQQALANLDQRVHQQFQQAAAQKQQAQSGPEMRLDPESGEAYTREQFEEYYQGLDEWHNAEPVASAEPEPVLVQEAHIEIQEEERRIDPDSGEAYTQQEFEEFYGGLQEWYDAEAVVRPSAPSMSVGRAQQRPAAQPISMSMGRPQQSAMSRQPKPKRSVRMAPEVNVREVQKQNNPRSQRNIPDLSRAMTAKTLASPGDDEDTEEDSTDDDDY